MVQGLRDFSRKMELPVRRYTECAHLYIAIAGAFLKGGYDDLYHNGFTEIAAPVVAYSEPQELIEIQGG